MFALPAPHFFTSQDTQKPQTPLNKPFENPPNLIAGYKEARLAGTLYVSRGGGPETAATGLNTVLI